VHLPLPLNYRSAVTVRFVGRCSTAVEHFLSACRHRSTVTAVPGTWRYVSAVPANTWPCLLSCLEVDTCRWASALPAVPPIPARSPPPACVFWCHHLVRSTTTDYLEVGSAVTGLPLPFPCTSCLGGPAACGAVLAACQLPCGCHRAVGGLPPPARSDACLPACGWVLFVTVPACSAVLFWVYLRYSEEGEEALPFLPPPFRGRVSCH